MPTLLLLHVPRKWPHRTITVSNLQYIYAKRTRTQASQTPPFFGRVLQPSHTLHSRRQKPVALAILVLRRLLPLVLDLHFPLSRHGEGAVLREGGAEAGEVDEGGGRHLGQIYQGARGRGVEIAPKECRYGTLETAKKYLGF
jgi:hypothetical protein